MLEPLVESMADACLFAELVKCVDCDGEQFGHHNNLMVFSLL